MSFTDVVILLLVISFLSFIIYFRWIKKGKNGSSCHCYKSQSCNLKIEDLKNIIKNEE